MRILIVTQVFPPEMGAQSNRLYPIVRKLVSAGHEVFVATGMPNYPQGVVFPEYRGKRIMREEREGFTIFRTASFVTPRNKSKWAQLLNYLSFIPAAFLGGLRAGKVDVVFITSPPIFSALPALWLAKLRRARLVFDIRDLWPDEIVACGAASASSLSVRVISAIEQRIYRIAACICCTTQPFIETVVSRGARRHETALIPNGADLEIFRPLPADNPIVREYPFDERFVVMYSGVLGIKHGLEVVLESARLLQSENRIVFFVLGSGARREALIKRAEKLELKNILFSSGRDVAEVPYLLARADICLSSLLSDPYLEKIITVKVFEYLACGKPIVAAVSGETARVLQESGGGIAVPPGDAHALAEAIHSLYLDPKRRQAMGRLGRRYVQRNFSREASTEKLEKTLRKLCDSKQADDSVSQEQWAQGPTLT